MKVDSLIGSLGQDSVVTTIVSFDSTLNPSIEIVELHHPTTMWNGSIEVTTTGGTSPYSYLWETGEQSELLTGLEGGIYTVTVTDANGCPATLRVPLCAFWASSGPGQTVVHFGPADDELISLYGGETGMLTVTMSDGRVLLDTEINLREEVVFPLPYHEKGVGFASLELPKKDGKRQFLKCKFRIF